MEDEIVQKITHEEEGEVEVVKEPSSKAMEEKREEESDVYDSERAID